MKKEFPEIGNVGKVILTVLVDNKADLIVESKENIKYFTDKPLLAEHGFSVLIQIDDTGERFLWDAGVSENSLVENMHRMELDIHAIAKIALSHGHSDHYAGVTALLKEMSLIPQAKEWGERVSREEVEQWTTESQLPIVSHPAAYRERWWKKKDGTLVGPLAATPGKEWEAAGAKIITSSKPYKLHAGCWTTGYVPRKSFEKSGRPTNLFYREGSEFLKDDLEEDQAIVINVRDKGLIVLSGCAHSGIVNIIEHAKNFTGIEKLYAIMGGFHLARAKDEEISETIEYIKKQRPVYVAPSHCSGLPAISRFAREMPEAFVEGVVGISYIL